MTWNLVEKRSMILKKSRKEYKKGNVHSLKEIKKKIKN